MCPLCKTPDCEIVYDLNRAESLEDVPGLVARCRSCPMWFKLLSDPAGIPEEYPGEYGEDDLATAYLASGAARAFFRETLANLEARPQDHPRLLDIGAAQGALLQEALRLGFDAEGIDRCESNVQSARAKSLVVTPLAAEHLEAEESFDVVTMMDILEHLPDPLLVLRAVHRALKPGGELVVYTPNHRAATVVLARLLHAVGIRYPVQQIFGRNHICFFDDRSLPLALQRTGFAVRLQRRFPYDTSRLGQQVSPLNLLALTLVERLAMPFGRVFRMVVYARKTAGPPSS